MAVSDDDARYFAAFGGARVVMVPNGVDCSAFASGMDARPWPPSLLYVGALDWPPNASAARLLADRGPAVGARSACRRRTSRSSARIPPPEVLALARTQPHVEVAANVRDVVALFPRRAPARRAARSGRRHAAENSRSVRGRAAGRQHAGWLRRDRRRPWAAPAGRRAARSSPTRSCRRCSIRRRRRSARCGRSELARQQYDWSAVGRRAIEAVACASAAVGRPAAALNGLAMQTEIPIR